MMYIHKLNLVFFGCFSPVMNLVQPKQQSLCLETTDTLNRMVLLNSAGSPVRAHAFTNGCLQVHKRAQVLTLGRT